MNLKDLSQFLADAKKNTYAKDGEGNETVLADGAKRFEYRVDDFSYLDKYSGFNPFLGKEAVFYQAEPVWQMTYRGEVTDSGIDARQVYEFLKQALRQVKTDKPFRGPSHFAEGFFEYINNTEGDVSKFRGIELIKLNNKEVYRLDYGGGLIKH